MGDNILTLKDEISKKTANLMPELKRVNEITIPQSTFGRGTLYEPISVLYISDLHIETHLKAEKIKDDPKSVSAYIRGLVEKLFDEDVLEKINNVGVSPNNLADLMNGYYYLFLDEMRELPEKERRELEIQLANKEYNKEVTPRLINCIIINGDLSDNIETAEMFFVSLKERIETYMQSFFRGRHYRCCPIYYVLGNHEYAFFQTVEKANEIFKDRLSNLGVTVLDKEYIEFGNCVVFGGTGFAKYNLNYNVNNQICPGEMYQNREVEFKESDRTLMAYNEALDIAKKGNKPLLSITHYPLKDWMNCATDRYCYYFTGHDHVNFLSHENNSHIYADNQIGYESKEIGFKEVLIGTSYNPFIDYEDGYYEITTKQYVDFYKYSGEYVGIGLIQKRLEKQSKLYMIKQNGFFGFFIVTPKNTMICAGGRVKTISNITDIRFFYECFCLMIYQYVSALLPFRKYQEQLSETIQKLNLPYHSAGRIHGCIVDVDFYHHIMINPYDGQLTFYFSPQFGYVEKLDSFGTLLESMEERDYRLKNDSSYLEAKQQFFASPQVISNKDATELGKHELEKIEIKGGLYSISGKVNQLQRLFTSNILRDWDEALIRNLIGNEAIAAITHEDKKLSDYNLVQKHWMNLQNVPSERISPNLVKCALNGKRKNPFPYIDIKKYGYMNANSMLSTDELRSYINHIPKSVLKLFIEEFTDALGLTILEVFPLDILKEKDYDYIFDCYPNNTREVIETAGRIPKDEWNKTLGTHIANEITVKNKPSYCSKELWETINSYKKR